MNTPDPEMTLIAPIAEILKELVQGVVTMPAAVSVKSSCHGNLVALQVKTDPDDVRRVIGAKGKHFKALETIVRTLSLMIQREAHLAVDDKGPPAPGVTAQKSFALGKTRDFSHVSKLLERTCAMFASNPNDVSVVSTDMGTTAIFEVKVKADSYAAVYGAPANFEYGPDGATIGAIKNIFDGIGKNHGRVIRIALTKLG